MDCDVEIDFDMQKQLRIEEVLNSIGYNIEKIMQEVGYWHFIFEKSRPKILFQVAHPCQRMLKKCIWMSEEKSCETLFKTIKTTLGYCCAFNYYAIKTYQ